MIYPADAKGMVEKWLLQVEKQMIKSLRDIISKAVPDYLKHDLGKWVTNWPGQAILAARSINWTAETTTSITENTLPKMKEKQYKQLEEIVQMVRNGLSKAVRSTVVALIVLDVHARDVIDKLEKKNVSSLNDFEWVSTMRYYLEKSTTEPNEMTVDLRYWKLSQLLIDFIFLGEHSNDFDHD